jgi:glycosyltransferase involved in cell wall biosynthesis
MLDIATLSVVLPARNEQANIGPQVAAALSACDSALARGLVGASEVVVVDDASTDQTGRVALSWGDPRVRVVRRDVSCGYGAALRAGFAAATGTRVAFCDADLQFDLAELGVLLRAGGTEDLVCGVRRTRCDPPRRRIAGWAWSFAVRFALGVGVQDVNCAFKVFPRTLVTDPPLTQDGASINAELLARARLRGLRVVEVPVTHRPRNAGRATGGDVRVALRAWRELISLRVRQDSGRHTL